jgi:hypothetical protein
MKCPVAPRAYEPARQPEVRKANHVIRVKMGQEYTVDVLPANPELGETLHGTSACVEEECLPACLDEDAWPEAIHGRHRGPRSEEGYFYLVSVVVPDHAPS